jgi:hypothetical protein
MNLAHRFVLILAVAALLLPASSMATMYYVPSGPFPTIQSALNVATQVDTVVVLPGVYSPGSGEVFPIDMRHGCTLLGFDATIDAMQTARAITCTLAIATIDGFTITGGHAQGMSPDDFGGGIYVRWSDLHLSNCTLIGNLADYEGGGINADECALWVTMCTFIENFGHKGGGIAASFVGPFSVVSSDFFSNGAVEHGGGIANFDSDAYISYCLFEGNYTTISYSDGGGVTTMGLGLPTLENCTFVNNTSVSDGSGLMMWNAANIDKCIFAFNNGPRAVGGTATWINCTDIFGNPGGDWTANIVAWLPMNANFSLDPMFCYAAFPPDPWTLDQSSPCWVPNSPCGAMVGARGAACGPSPVEDASWGAIKALYR